MEVSGEQDEVDWVVLGIGLNVNTEFSELPVALRRTATSLKMAGGELVDRSDVLATLLLSLEAHYQAALRGGFDKALHGLPRARLPAVTHDQRRDATGPGRRRRRRHRRPRRAARRAAAPPGAQLPLRRRERAALSEHGGPAGRFDDRPGGRYIVTSSASEGLTICPASPPESSPQRPSSRRSCRSPPSSPSRSAPCRSRCRSTSCCSPAWCSDRGSACSACSPTSSSASSRRSTRAAPPGSARSSARRAGYLFGFIGAALVAGLIAGRGERTAAATARRRARRARADLRARRDVAGGAAPPDAGRGGAHRRRAVRVAGRAEGGGGRAHGAGAGQPAAGSSCRDPERPLTSARA